MSGTIGCVVQAQARYSAFLACMESLQRPPNTKFDMVESTDIPGARNTLVQRALENGSEWILMLDDDHTFGSDFLWKLLAHEKPIVSGLYLARAGGHEPIAFSHRRADKLYERINLPELPAEGLLRVKAVGAGGLLVRSEVFWAIDENPTWFEHGRVIGEDWNAAEDIIFCEKAQKAGFDVFVDLGARMGHMAPSAIWPEYVDNQWCLGFSVADGTQLYVPIEPKQADPAHSYEEVAQ